MVEVGVVNACDDEASAVVVEVSSFVEQKGEPCVFKEGDHFHEVVIAEDAEDGLAKDFEDDCGLADCGSVVAGGFVTEVTGDDG